RSSSANFLTPRSSCARRWVSRARSWKPSGRRQGLYRQAVPARTGAGGRREAGRLILVSIRVLVVDDSALMRQMISRFRTEAGMEVVATARDGVEGLEKALALRPDVVTLDVEMPRMEGLTMLGRLMEQAPMPVVMVSSVTQRQAPATIEALMLGAVDVVAKPGGSISVNLGDVREELIAKVRAAARARVRPRRGRMPGDGPPVHRAASETAAAQELAPEAPSRTPEAPERKPGRAPKGAPGPGP